MNATPTVESTIASTMAGQRGALIVTERAVRRLVEGALSAAPLPVRDVSVDIVSLHSDRVAIGVEAAVLYLDEPMSRTLHAVREHLTEVVERLLGRDVEQVDLTVIRFVLAAEVDARGPGRNGPRVL
ncbi:MAG: hypothetical protein AB7L13_15030 [Acidimicrobiia bacterium]